MDGIAGTFKVNRQQTFEFDDHVPGGKAVGITDVAPGSLAFLGDSDRLDHEKP